MRSYIKTLSFVHETRRRWALCWCAFIKFSRDLWSLNFSFRKQRRVTKNTSRTKNWTRFVNPFKVIKKRFLWFCVLWNSFLSPMPNSSWHAHERRYDNLWSDSYQGYERWLLLKLKGSATVCRSCNMLRVLYFSFSLALFTVNDSLIIIVIVYNHKLQVCSVEITKNMERFYLLWDKLCGQNSWLYTFDLLIFVSDYNRLLCAFPSSN